MQHIILRAIAVSYGRPKLWPFPTPKPLNRSIQNCARLIISAIYRAVPKFITIGCTEAPPTHTRNILCAFSCFFFAFFCVLSLRTARTASHTKMCFWCRKWHGLMTYVQKGSKTPKPPNIWPPKNRQTFDLARPIAAVLISRDFQQINRSKIRRKRFEVCETLWRRTNRKLSDFQNPSWPLT